MNKTRQQSNTFIAGDILIKKPYYITILKALENPTTFVQTKSSSSSITRKYRGYEGYLGVKRKLLKSSTTFSTVTKFIKAIKMSENNDEQKLLSLTEYQNMDGNFIFRILGIAQTKSLQTMIWSTKLDPNKWIRILHPT